ncbi:glucosylglycerol 3-phosphatase [Synechococcus sp. RSCCF101]|uniref:glucosylglycerol 3-phosphatase n=1 Tax=Synechococcus sp. RSCCF101 TaxID=2511069 RepID=UPI0012450E5B|nr:glucosylglycerol 3-phosphatase [Synechococcus sp. RSCCF101]QEY31073.1 glucosylglycerol 3-phosphatase [Synechococcus sp. RSCCF101]
MTTSTAPAGSAAIGQPPPLPGALEALADDLAGEENLLLIQDLDGVCMPLVRDPLTRAIDPAYVRAARTLNGRFQVLTNGEHLGERGVNGIVERAMGGAALARDEGLYLPGLAAGGVQLQTRLGEVCHPGVSDAELAFLAGVPDQASSMLQGLLSEAPFRVPEEDRSALIRATVLVNRVSPTLNLNSLHSHFGGDWTLTLALQERLDAWMHGLLADAREQGLEGSFFLHLAPNLGSVAGREQLKPAGPAGVGTTDFQLMLRGAIKEAGLLVLLNRHVERLTGHAPLGRDFNVRGAPRDIPSMLALARKRFDPAWMPRLVGVGDTVTSEPPTAGQASSHRRGGSDRGFLTLIQELGRTFGKPNEVLLVDSSDGEVDRPSLRNNPDLHGISDAMDPLRLTGTFPGGHREYIQFFIALARRRQQVAQQS